MGFKAANRESFPYIMHIVDEPRKFSPSNVLTYTVACRYIATCGGCLLLKKVVSWCCTDAPIMTPNII